MNTQTLDNNLRECGVEFLPWIGTEYEYGISYDKDGQLQFGTQDNPGQRVLVLGESHYIGEDEIDDFNNDKEGWSLFTRNVLDDYLDANSHWARWKNTFLKFERSIANSETEHQDCVKIWNHLAFYNYLQVPMTEPRVSPSDDALNISVQPFFKLLEAIKPDFVIVWGKRLYNELPVGCKELCISGREDKSIIEEDYTTPTWIYSDNKGRSIKLIPVIHPSWGYSWEYWFNVIKAGIQNGK